jgi:UDP-N-acetylmuramoyl-tripeptide--D-alanyl-D-alanine ligase
MPALWGEIAAEEILLPAGGTLLFGKGGTLLKGLSTDSRTIGPGELFWALKGDRYDGHEFVDQAIRGGAAGVVGEWNWWESSPDTRTRLRDAVGIAVADTLQALGDLAMWWRRQYPVRVVAITGSAGKTTTKEMAAEILSLGRRTLKNQGNFNNLIGLPLTLLQLTARHGNAALEMGMNRPGEIARLTEIAAPDVGVITNVGMAHLEGVGSLDGVARAKTEMLGAIGSDRKVALWGDDDRLMKAAAAYERSVTTFGLGGTNQVRAEKIRNLGLEGMAFDLRFHGESWPVKLKTPGTQNVLNALAAASAAFCLGEPIENIISGLGRFAGVNGRFVVSRLPCGATLVDDTYNANPSSLQASLSSVGALAREGGRLLVGLGEMLELGHETVAAHLQAGREVAKLRPFRFLAMGEHAADMVKGALMSGMPSDRIKETATHEEMAAEIGAVMADKDLVFLKGSRRVGLDRVVLLLKETRM